MKRDCNYLRLQFFFPSQSMIWNIGDNRNLLLKLSSKLGLYHVVLTSAKTSQEKLTLTVVEMQQLPDIEKTDSKKQISGLKWTIYIGKRKVCVHLKTDTDNLNIILYRYYPVPVLILTSKKMKLI